MNLLITGGCGFIGSHLARAASGAGHSVTVLDNYDRPQARAVARSLRSAGISVIGHDVRHPLPSTLDADVIVHAAGNVDHKRATGDPAYDLHVNGIGSINVLEHAYATGAAVLYISTCKVYSTRINTWAYIESNTRYEYPPSWWQAIKETAAINDNATHGHGFYGCSKIAGEMYAQDYHLTRNVPVIINRLSSVYGPTQYGTEGYGWVSWFVRAVKTGQPITIHGSGKQVRDVLHIDDLTRLLMYQIVHIDDHAGNIYNVGGGPDNTLSILELLAMLEDLGGTLPPIEHDDERPADFRVYISDITKVKGDTGWTPTISLREGITQLWES